MVQDSGQAGAQIEVTAEMLEAGRVAFRRWFNRPENAEALIELPRIELVDELARQMFLMMRDSASTSVRN